MALEQGAAPDWAQSKSWEQGGQPDPANIPEWAIQREWTYEVLEYDGNEAKTVKAGTVKASTDLVRFELCNEYHLSTWRYAGTKQAPDGSITAVRLVGRHKGRVYTMTATRM